MTEMDKLEAYLKDTGYIYERIKRAEFEGEQIIVYNTAGIKVWDVICHNFSYGHEEGLLEAYGNIVVELGDVEGYLTADDIISRLEALQC